MANFLTSLFGRAEKKEEPLQPVSGLLQEYDEEYIRYCIEQEQVVSAQEASLHTSDDPKEIAMQTLKVACSFYGGDWAGILEVDLDLDVWNPLWWFNMSKQDRTVRLFGKFEIAKFMPNWVQSLKSGTPIIIPDAKTVRKDHPEEYEVYKRLEVDSVIGVPFGPNPVGFLAIRNPTRHINRPSMMSILAYVLHRAMAQSLMFSLIGYENLIIKIVKQSLLSIHFYKICFCVEVFLDIAAEEAKKYESMDHHTFVGSRCCVWA